MNGFFNKLLRINLSRREATEEKLEDEVLARHLGGRGLGSYLLLEELPQGVDPLSPHNKVIIATGPATDTRVPMATRYGMYTKAPLTNLYGETYSGGASARQIKRTGYDAIVIEGASDEPVYLEITPDGVTFNDASKLWGKDTFDTEREVIEASGYKGAKAISIGPAGESLVRFACVENDKWRSAGRGGFGAVFGSKKLKSIVFYGSDKLFYGRETPRLHDKQGLEEFSLGLIEQQKDSATFDAYNRFGTPQLTEITNEAHSFPTKYWNKGSFEKADRLGARALHEDFEVRPKSCMNCFVSCGNLATVKKGKYKGLTIEGPEYETIATIGGLCMIGDMPSVAYLNDLCDRYGMDTITTGNICAMAIEASQQGKIDRQLKYGDTEEVARLIGDIVIRRGLGDILAQGTKIAAKQLDMEDQAIHVKGMEPPGYDPRGLWGMGLTYSTVSRGACHLRTTFYKAELSGMIDPHTMEGKAEMLIGWEDRMSVYDTLVLCRFIRDWVFWDELNEIIYRSTGLDYDEEDFRKLGARVVDLTREFNVREGATKEDDLLPQRFHSQPTEAGVVPKDEFMNMLGEYYKIRGWD